MNWEHVEGHWHKVVGQVKTKWARLTDEDLKHVAGQRVLLSGRLQARYGVVKDEAEKQIEEWLAKLRRSDGVYESADKETDERP